MITEMASVEQSAAEEIEASELASVLVVDDSPVMRLIATTLIKSACGYTTFAVNDGCEAVKFLQEQSVSLILTDIQMPNMDGFELVEYVKANCPLIPIILMTGGGSEETAFRALQAGAANYVPKSKLKAELGAILHTVLVSSRLERRKTRVLQSLTARDSHFVLENDPQLVPLLIAMLQEELSATKTCQPSSRTRLGVALEEALLNAMYHGNLEVSSDLKQLPGSAFHDLANERREMQPYAARRVHVHTHLDEQGVTYTIRDEGRGFDISKLPDPCDPENLEKSSGRGLLLIRLFMDEVRYNATGNEITLVKKRETN